MTKFYSIRVIEAKTRQQVIKDLRNGEANFIDTDDVSDAVLALNDLWKKLPAKKLVSLNPDRRTIIKLGDAIKGYAFYCYCYGVRDKKDNHRPMKSFDNYLKTEI